MCCAIAAARCLRLRTSTISDLQIQIRWWPPVSPLLQYNGWVKHNMTNSFYHCGFMGLYDMKARWLLGISTARLCLCSNLSMAASVQRLACKSASTFVRRQAQRIGVAWKLHQVAEVTPTASNNQLTWGCGYSDRKRGVKEHTTFTSNCLSLGVWFASFPISRPCVNECFRVTGPWKPNVALLTPGFTPTVSNQPAIFGVAHSLDTMIQNGTVVTTATCEDATTIELPGSSRNGHRDRTSCCQSGFQCTSIVHRKSEVTARLHCSSVCRTLGVLPFVWHIAFKRNTFRDGEVESQLHCGPFTTASPTTIMRVFHTVHIGLWCQRQQLARRDCILRLHSLCCRKCPARTTTALQSRLSIEDSGLVAKEHDIMKPVPMKIKACCQDKGSQTCWDLTVSLSLSLSLHIFLSAVKQPWSFTAVTTPLLRQSMLSGLGLVLSSSSVLNVWKEGWYSVALIALNSSSDQSANWFTAMYQECKPDLYSALWALIFSKLASNIPCRWAASPAP